MTKSLYITKVATFVTRILYASFVNEKLIFLRWITIIFIKKILVVRFSFLSETPNLPSHSHWIEWFRNFWALFFKHADFLQERKKNRNFFYTIVLYELQEPCLEKKKKIRLVATVSMVSCVWKKSSFKKILIIDLCTFFSFQQATITKT